MALLYITLKRVGLRPTDITEISLDLAANPDTNDWLEPGDWNFDWIEDEPGYVEDEPELAEVIGFPERI